MARHIHNTYASRVIEEREANTILWFPSSTGWANRKNGFPGLTESTCVALGADITLGSGPIDYE